MIINPKTDLNVFRPVVFDLISYYYNELGNCTGGSLHIVLDDGNLDEGFIWHCQEFAEEEGDEFGYFLATLLRHFTTEELEQMYEADWKKETTQ